MSSPSYHQREGVVASDEKRMLVAAEWLVREKAGLSADETEGFGRWLASDPRNAAAVDGLRETWNLLEKPRLAGQAEFALERIATEARARAAVKRRWAWSALGLSAAAAIAFAFYGMESTKPIAAPVLAVAPSVNSNVRHLPDGSIAELTAGAEISIDFSTNVRRVRLTSGQAYFDVAKDATRPFIVEAGPFAVRALGTKFAVTIDAKKFDVLLTEGHVTVERFAAQAPAPAQRPSAVDVVKLEPGTRLSVNLSEDQPLATRAASSSEISAALTWRNTRVEFSDTPLAEALERFNVRNRIKLSVSDPALGEIRISGIFWTDDPEAFARLIHASANLKVSRPSNDHIRLER